MAVIHIPSSDIPTGVRVEGWRSLGNRPPTVVIRARLAVQATDDIAPFGVVS
jgi:hypothetical protein